MADSKRYNIRAPMRAKDGTLYRPGRAVAVKPEHAKEFGWDKSDQVGAPEAGPPTARERTNQRLMEQRKAQGGPVLSAENVKDVSVKDLPQALAQVTDADQLEKLAKADDRSTAAEHYKARKSELQTAATQPPQGEGDGDGEQDGDGDGDGEE